MSNPIGIVEIQRAVREAKNSGNPLLFLVNYRRGLVEKDLHVDPGAAYHLSQAIDLLAAQVASVPVAGEVQ